MRSRSSSLPPLDTETLATVERFGGQATPLDPLGFQVAGIDLSRREPPPPELTRVIEREMARQGFVVFKNEQQIEVDDFLRVSCWWGGKALHSTHGVHPATPGGNRHIFRLTELCRQYCDLLDQGFAGGYAIAYEYREHDCLFIDNLAVAHRASPGAHLPVEQQGLRIMHRSTVRGTRDLAPGFGLPLVLDITGPSPFGEGVWQSGGIGFRWDQARPMQN